MTIWARSSSGNASSPAAISTISPSWGSPSPISLPAFTSDYHRPTDTPEKIDYQELQMVARTVGAVGWELGNGSGRPKLNATLPEDLKRAMENARKEGWGKRTPVLAAAAWHAFLD